MEILIFNGKNHKEVETFIENNELEYTEMVRAEGEVRGYGGYHKAPCVLIVDKLDVRNECIILPKNYYDSLLGEE